MNRTTASAVALSVLVAITASCSAADPTAHTAKDIPDGPAAAAPAPAPAGSSAGTTIPLADRMRALDKQVYKVSVDDLPTIGSSSAPLTVVLFSDYECPYCRRLEPQIAQLRAEHGSDVRIVLAPKPLPFHKQARPAALAALAASEQGKLEPMHRALVALDGKLDDAALTSAAREAGLDLARFDADRHGAKVEQILARANALAERFSVNGTPTTFLNGRRITGAMPDVVRQLGEEQLAAARALVKGGTPPERVYETIIASGVETAPPEPMSTVALGRAPVDPKQINTYLLDMMKCGNPYESKTVELTIDADGKVARVTTDPPASAGCIQTTAASWRFQKAQGESKVKFTVNKR